MMKDEKLNVKAGLAYLIALPGLLFLLVFEGIPALFSLLLSFKDYNPHYGIFGSPAAPNGGLGNFLEFLNSPYVVRVIRNTLGQNVLPVVLVFAVAFVLVWCISRIPQRSARIAALCVLAVPVFVPAVVLAGNAVMALSPSTGWVNQLRAALERAAGNIAAVLFWGKAAAGLWHAGRNLLSETAGVLSSDLLLSSGCQAVGDTGGGRRVRVRKCGQVSRWQGGCGAGNLLSCLAGVSV